MSNELIKRIISSLLILPLVIFIIIKGSFYFNITLLLIFLISVYEWLNISKNSFFSFIGIIFLAFSLMTIYQIRFNLHSDYIYLLLILIICIGSDVGGFIFGKIIKGPKLTKISPNKTYSGMMGSFILPILIIYLLSEKNFSFFKITLDLKNILFIFYVSLISQLGDLVISFFKRTANLKNTGKLIPGHGGLLDRIDGMIFAFPFSYLIILILDINIL